MKGTREDSLTQSRFLTLPFRVWFHEVVLYHYSMKFFFVSFHDFFYPSPLSYPFTPFSPPSPSLSLSLIFLNSEEFFSIEEFSLLRFPFDKGKIVRYRSDSQPILRVYFCKSLCIREFLKGGTFGKEFFDDLLHEVVLLLRTVLSSVTH